MFACIDKSDGENGNEVSLHDIQQNIKDYSYKDLRSLASVLIDAYPNLINENESFEKNHDGFEIRKPPIEYLI